MPGFLLFYDKMLDFSLVGRHQNACLGYPRETLRELSSIGFSFIFVINAPWLDSLKTIDLSLNWMIFKSGLDTDKTDKHDTLVIFSD